MSDASWRRYTRNNNIEDEIACAKQAGLWDKHCGIFLMNIAEGGVPLSALLTEEGRKWLDEIVISRR